MPDAIRFQVTDPREYTIVCTDTQWDDHILIQHPDMAGDEDLVVNALENPSLGIYQDVKDSKRHIYYNRPPKSNLYVKVVVEFDDQNHGEVKTAYRAASPKRGEKLLWL